MLMPRYPTEKLTGKFSKIFAALPGSQQHETTSIFGMAKTIVPRDDPYFALCFARILIATSRRRFEMDLNALKKTYTTGSALETKCDSLQAQYHHLQYKMEREASHNFRKLEEAAFQNDVLNFQLELARTESAEHRATIKTMTGELQQASQQVTALACTIEQLKSEISIRDAEVVALESIMAEKNTVLSRLEQTCKSLKARLRRSYKDRQFEVSILRTTMTSQFEAILALHSELEMQQQQQHIKLNG